jgi:uncharacterized protein YaaN involved in tellurite resistance
VSSVPVPEVPRAPEALTPVTAAAGTEQGAELVPLKLETRAAIGQQVERLVAALLHDDLHDQAFKVRLQWLLALGREEVADAAGLMQGGLMQRHVAGVQDQAAHEALAGLRAQIEDLNPDRDGDLLRPRKLFGLIPLGGNRLDAYFRRHAQAVPLVQALVTQIYAARDGLQHDGVDIEAVRSKLWEAMHKLAAAAYFARTLDARLEGAVQALQASDPLRAKTLNEEALFYVRQRLQDIQTQQAVCVNGYLALDVLKKTGREMMNGCSRVATTGMSALAVAQTVARATGNQIKVMEMLGGVNSSIESLIAESGRQLNTHVEKTTQFAQNPMIGIEKLKEMFDQTFKAMDAMDDFRSKAIDVMGQNNAMIKEQLAKADQYVDRQRQQQAREATRAAISGPVAL